MSTNPISTRTIPFACLLAAVATPAGAELPQPVRDMVDAAIASGDRETVETVIAIAKQTNQDDAAELDAMLAEFSAAQSELAAAEAAEAQDSDEGEAAEETLVESNGFFDNWSGRGEIGASRSTGNTDNLGLSIGLDLNRESERWQHRFHASADLRRSNGNTTREEYVASYEPRFKLSDPLYIYALAQWEQDRFQGYSSRFSTSGGFGYRVIEEDDMHLTAQAGPAWRRTEYTGGTVGEHFSAMGTLNFDWTIARNLTLTQVANAYFDSDTTTITSTTGLEAAINGSLRARFSYVVDHETGVLSGPVKTDTLSRITLVYGF